MTEWKDIPRLEHLVHFVTDPPVTLRSVEVGMVVSRALNG
ncbi:hypothetical protein EMGBS4_04650 [Acidimicrobiaceae bacterium]|nr:hypothetical protein EMGBS4_04650 [Acidimicrobiaceae bacterium]